MDRPWLTPSWKEIVIYVIASALLFVAWRCFNATASFFMDTLRTMRTKKGTPKPSSSRGTQ